MWVTSLPNVRYLTGYAGSNGLVLLLHGEAHFFTDPRYATDAKTNIDCKVHICKGPLYQDALQVVKRKRLKIGRAHV